MKEVGTLFDEFMKGFCIAMLVAVGITAAFGGLLVALAELT